MSTIKYVYRRTRPRLVVTMGESRSPFSCYSETDFTITSTYPLSLENLDGLFASGAIGYGQDYRVIDRSDKPSSYDETPCIGIDGDKVIENPLNPYSGQPYKPIQEPVYVYKVQTVCDSGD